jgi:hypothetical protein
MKVQFLTASHFGPLESSWRTKYPGEKLIPGVPIFASIEKNYAFFLPEIMMPESGVLHYVLSDLIWNCKQNNIGLVFYSFSSHVVSAIMNSIQDETLKLDEVDFWWIELKNNERVYITLRLK